MRDWCLLTEIADLLTGRGAAEAAPTNQPFGLTLHGVFASISVIARCWPVIRSPFVPPPPRAGGINVWDLSAHKNVKVWERLALPLRGEAEGAMNTPNFAGLKLLW